MRRADVRGLGHLLQVDARVADAGVYEALCALDCVIVALHARLASPHIAPYGGRKGDE